MKCRYPGIGVRHVKRKITGIRIALTTLVYALHKNTLHFITQVTNTLTMILTADVGLGS